ncbi:MAG TPA: MarR family winged helix-turn-helix transcriptional regulator [Blastocatellia bacterium]|nr:MarR family winged helix-turn-helix transcriptional regulator [Blastocatellia bacterium]
MKRDGSSTAGLPCMCASIRRVSRSLTQLYDEALRPAGLRATQFTLLQALSRKGEMTQGQLGQMLAIDSTTLTRTLEILSRDGWIQARRGEDRRERLLQLSPAGKRKLERALPHWKKLQARLRDALGDERWSSLLEASNELTDVITDFAEKK